MEKTSYKVILSALYRFLEIVNLLKDIMRAYSKTKDSK